MSDQMESLSSILGESPFSTGAPDTTPPVVEQKVETPVVEAEKPEVVVEKARDESGRFAPKAEPKTEKPPLQPADVAAIIDERRKRQELERKLQQYEAGKPKPDFWENPEQAVNARLQEFVDPLRSELLNLQVENARLKHTDFDDAMIAFLEASQKDENLRLLADNAPNPLQFIYREGKRIKELAPYDGDLNKRDEARFGELKGEVSKRDEQIKALQAQLDQLTKSQAELAAVPRSLNQLQSGAPKATDADPDDIRNLVRFK